MVPIHSKQENGDKSSIKKSTILVTNNSIKRLEKLPVIALKL